MGELGQKTKNLGDFKSPHFPKSFFLYDFFSFPLESNYLQSPTNFVLKILNFLSKLPIHPQYFLGIF
jgi:hypothetical protein